VTLRILFLIFILSAVLTGQTRPPAPVLPIPSRAQLEWQKLEYYAFVHFGMNTFTGHEWGEGRARATQFVPTAFDARQWARVVKAAGMKGIIITAKHHDGFALWPTATTEYSVKNTNWRGGKGDVLKDLAAACKESGLKFGVYISPWDRNHPLYGTPEYNEIYKQQWREVLSNYGEVFEAWLDGASDGTKPMKYDFDGFFRTIRRSASNAVIFSDAGPDVRWIGNESGIAGETNWSTRNNEGTLPGKADAAKLNTGDEDGSSWIPGECDVSIRPGWFYHKEEDTKLKSVEKLMEIWLGSVGRNCNLLLNIGVDRRGLVNENDIARLMEFKKRREIAFGKPIVPSRVIASNTRGNSKAFSPQNVLDNSFESSWATDDEVTSATLTVEFRNEVEVNAVMIQENIALGQRVKKFSLQTWNGREFVTVSTNTTIGYKRIIQFPTTKTKRLRINIEESKGPMVISTVRLFKVA
jgi:alpha-L-fucosidase